MAYEVQAKNESTLLHVEVPAMPTALEYERALQHRIAALRQLPFKDIVLEYHRVAQVCICP